LLPLSLLLLLQLHAKSIAAIDETREERMP
jgi:hypothetical protein